MSRIYKTGECVLVAMPLLITDDNPDDQMDGCPSVMGKIGSFTESFLISQLKENGVKNIIDNLEDEITKDAEWDLRAKAGVVIALEMLRKKFGISK